MAPLDLPLGPGLSRLLLEPIYPVFLVTKAHQEATVQTLARPLILLHIIVVIQQALHLPFVDR